MVLKDPLEQPDQLETRDPPRMKVNGKFNSIDEDLIDVILKPIISRMLFKVSEGDDRKMKDLL